jgi:dihydroorotate dehydrogenase electron transfer subunit
MLGSSGQGHKFAPSGWVCKNGRVETQYNRSCPTFMKVRFHPADGTEPATAPLVAPTLNEDGTLTAVVIQSAVSFGAARLLTLALPSGLNSAPASGRYLLARCGAQTPLERAEQWSFPLRTPLFFVGAGPAFLEQTEGAEAAAIAEPWTVALPPDPDPAGQWLGELPAGATLNLLGPLGQGFVLQPQTRNLLLIGDLARLPLLFCLLEQMLDRNGRVTLLLRLAEPLAESIREHLPIPVELRLAQDETSWQHHLGETIGWADQVAVALPNPAYAPLAEAIRQRRLRLEQGFAQALIQVELPCGVGACLACTIPLPNGSRTRACVHGPVFDLTTLLL